VIKQFLLCSIYGLEGDLQQALKYIGSPLCRSVCGCLAPQLFDILSSLAMGTVEQRAHPLAYEVSSPA
jgi:hypothetical protein